MKISINALSTDSIEAAIRQLEEYRDGLEQKAQDLCERLAEQGLMYAEWNFSGVQWTYSGEVDYSISVDKLGDGKYAVKAEGSTVLLLEFGAGVRLGGGHPMEAEFGMGVGTYPGQKHAFDPNGWWYKDGDGKHHTYGNAAGMPMYNAAKDLRKEIEAVAREVFQQ